MFLLVLSKTHFSVLAPCELKYIGNILSEIYRKLGIKLVCPRPGRPILFLSKSKYDQILAPGWRLINIYPGQCSGGRGWLQLANLKAICQRNVLPDILCSFAWPRKPFITINNSREHESETQSANQRPVSRSCDHSQPIRGRNCSAKANEKPRNHIGNRR